MGRFYFVPLQIFFHIPKKKYKVGWSLLYYHLVSVSPFDITKVSIIFDTTKFISYYFILLFFLIPRQLSVVGVKCYPYLCGVTFKNK
jgi:hypothetical protein